MPERTARRPHRAGAEETPLALKRRARRINKILAEQYPYAVAELDFRNPFELVVATVLSAQTTDVRVNQVTPELFSRWPDAASLAGADEDEVTAVVRPLGDTRPAWKVLRVLANLLGVPGFDFETSQDVLARATNAAAGSVTQVPADQLSNAVTKPASAAAAAVGEPVVASIYQLDGLVRRSTSLQLTADARLAREGAAA